MPSLIEEATERMKAQAAAQSIINDNDEWFKAHWGQLGSFEAAGMWAGKRRQYTEGYDRGLVYEAGLEVGLTYEDVFPYITDGQIKKLVKEFPALVRKMNELDPEDGGMALVPGNWNFTPVKKRPSDDKYEIDEPGAAEVDSPSTEGEPATPAPEINPAGSPSPETDEAGELTPGD